MKVGAIATTNYGESSAGNAIGRFHNPRPSAIPTLNYWNRSWRGRGPGKETCLEVGNSENKSFYF